MGCHSPCSQPAPKSSLPCPGAAGAGLPPLLLCRRSPGGRRCPGAVPGLARKPRELPNRSRADDRRAAPRSSSGKRCRAQPPSGFARPTRRRRRVSLMLSAAFSRGSFDLLSFAALGLETEDDLLARSSFLLRCFSPRPLFLAFHCRKRKFKIK